MELTKAQVAELAFIRGHLTKYPDFKIRRGVVWSYTWTGEKKIHRHVPDSRTLNALVRLGVLVWDNPDGATANQTECGEFKLKEEYK